MLSTSIEDYIKAIYSLEADEQKASTKKIAQRLGVKMASVTGMVKHLAAEGYVKHTPYRGVQMTAKGRSVALKTIRRHRIIELFLAQTLGLTWDEVDADAEILEHAVSDRLVERMYEHLGRPAFDPHGAPIPATDSTIPVRQGVPLTELKAGDHGRIVEVSDRDADFLRYMTSLKLGIGSEVTVIDVAPFNGPVTMKLDTKTIAIGTEACSRIRVTVGKRKRSRGAAKGAKA